MIAAISLTDFDHCREDYRNLRLGPLYLSGGVKPPLQLFKPPALFCIDYLIWKNYQVEKRTRF